MVDYLGVAVLIVVVMLCVWGIARLLRRFLPAGDGRVPSRYGDEWRGLRLRALRRDGFQCASCGSAFDLQVHHIVPLSQGGTNDLGNLQTLCGACHARVHPH